MNISPWTYKHVTQFMFSHIACFIFHCNNCIIFMAIDWYCTVSCFPESVCELWRNCSLAKLLLCQMMKHTSRHKRCNWNMTHTYFWPESCGVSHECECPASPLQLKPIYISPHVIFTQMETSTYFIWGYPLTEPKNSKLIQYQRQLHKILRPMMPEVH